MKWDLEEQRMRARFCELRKADREASVPGFEEVCRDDGRRVRLGWLGVAAGVAVMIAGAAAVVMWGSGQQQAVAQWPDIEIVVPEDSAMDELPTAPLLTYVDDTSGTWPGDRGWN